MDLQLRPYILALMINQTPQVKLLAVDREGWSCMRGQGINSCISQSVFALGF